MDDLDGRLHDLRTHLDTGPPPDVATVVVQRLRTDPPPLAVRARRRLVALVSAALAAVLVGGLLAVPAVRAAVVEWLSLPGVVFDRERPQPPTPTVTPGGPLGAAYTLRTRVRLNDVRDRFPLPTGVGDPDEVYVTGSAYHFLWRATSDLPSLPGSTAGLYVSVFTPEADALLQKMIRDVPVEQVRVGDRRGLWIGTEHGTVLIGPDGWPDYSTERVAGPTLLVDNGGFTVRIESRLSRDGAIALAESFR